MSSEPRILIAGGDRTYRLLRLPTASRRLRAVAGWTLALLLPREAASLDVPEHPRQDFQAVLDIIAHGPPRAAPSQGRGKERTSAMLTTGEQREFRQIWQELRKADRGFAWQLTALQGALRLSAPVRRAYLLIAAAATAGLPRLVTVAGRLLRAYAKGVVLMDPIALIALADASWPGWGSGRDPGTGASPAPGRSQPDGEDP